jgi:hypothetical protein
MEKERKEWKKAEKKQRRLEDSARSREVYVTVVE